MSPQSSLAKSGRRFEAATARRCLRVIAVLGAAACVGGAEPAQAQAPAVLVKDINQQFQSYGVELYQSGQEKIANVEGTVFFRGCSGDGTTGCELWKSDGTAAGTVLVKDIVPGIGNSYPSWLTDLNGTLFFTADDGVHGRELWKSDGTATGTVLVKDLLPGLGGSFDPAFWGSNGLINVNGTLFFSAYDGANRWELWKSDGTEAGTVLMKDILPGFPGASPTEFTDVNGTLFFTGCSPDATNENYSDCELWKSDGTEAGTVLVKDILPGSYGYGSSLPRDLVNANGTLLFTAEDGTHGRELWKSDGTEAGTVLVKDIVPGSDGSSTSQFIYVDETLFFSACSGTYNWDCDLWKSDGTEAGTVLVKVFFPIPGYTYARPRSLTDVNGTLFFKKCSADEDAIPATDCRELWKSDGSGAGTVLVKDIRPTTDAVGLTNVDGTLFFASMGKLWKSDGTAAGTVVIEQFPLGPSGQGPTPDLLVSSNGMLFFRACSAEGWDCSLWKSDGTEAGTVGVKDGVPGSEGSYPSLLTPVNGTLFFSADDGSNGNELWKSDGTEAGTVLVKDILSGSEGSYPMDHTDVSGVLFFSARDGTSGREIWKSDGTSAGTARVKDIWPGSRPDREYDAVPSHLADWNGLLFFSAYDGAGNWLWKSDGADTGTVRVKDGWPEQLTAVNDGLLFYVNVVGSGYETLGELWKSDGTTAGTVLVKNPWYWGPDVEGFLTNVNGTLFFVGWDWQRGSELWKSDGTEAGTVIVKDIALGEMGSAPRSLTDVGGTLFFVADGEVTGELWKSDGTEAGTVIVKDIGPEDLGSAPYSLTEVGGTLFFGADDGVTGQELWKSDGTEAGTALVEDIFPGNEGSFPSSLTNVNGTLFFAASDGMHGPELWKSDGISGGTVLAADVIPGYVGSNPADLVAVDSALFFSAIGEGIGRELWVLPPADCADGSDNDGDGFTDLDDPGCADQADADERAPTLLCDDGADNDGDGRSDHLAGGGGDPGCSNPISATESPQCQDGLDNDGQLGIDFDGGDSLDIEPRDGFIDARFNPATPVVGEADPQCLGRPYQNREAPTGGGCGLGAELVLVMPLLGLAASWRRRANPLSWVTRE